MCYPSTHSVSTRYDLFPDVFGTNKGWSEVVDRVQAQDVRERHGRRLQAAQERGERR